MSIKSQRSLNEECSEIFERSYSVRSASDESLSCDDDDDEALARQLMHKMKPHVLTKLKRCFKKSKERTQSIDVDKRVEEVMRAAAAEEGIEFARSEPPPADALYLHENGFVTAINNIFGHHKYSTHAQKLFRLLDRFSSGRVSWGQLVTKLVGVGATRLPSRAHSWVPIPDPLVKRLNHSKREVIAKLVPIEREDSFCYVAITKGGRVGIYDGKLQLLNSYDIFYQRSGVRRRVKNSWITDAIYLNDVKCLLVCASDRSLTIYDATTISHTPLYCITGLPNIPTCAAYRPAVGVGASSELALGDAHGDILRLTFTHPRIQLLHSTANDSINYYYWMELFSPPHTSHVTITRRRHVHARVVTRLAYARDGNMLLSCSHDNALSVTVTHLAGNLDDYTFKLPRGVSCFAWVERRRVLALCSAGAVVLWDARGRQCVPLAPHGSPAPPRARALDVAAAPRGRLLLVWYDDCMLHIWDLDEECLLQTLKVNFPFLGVLGKKVEFGTYSIFPGPPRRRVQGELEAEEGTGSVLQPDAGDNSLTDEDFDSEYQKFNTSEILVTCCDFVAVISMRQQEGEVPPPPGDTLQPRKPSLWDLTQASLFGEGHVPIQAACSSLSPRVLEPLSADSLQHGLDDILGNAGLEGILEKDFILMKGLKHDLNRKMAAMEADKESMRTAVCMGAPYLALRTHELDSMPPLNEMTDEYQRIMRLFPSCSTNVTPAGSRTPTPRSNRTTRL